jgi:hypothetical protein
MPEESAESTPRGWLARHLEGPIQRWAFIVVLALFLANVIYWVISNWPLGPSVVHVPVEQAMTLAEFSVAFGTISLALASYNQFLSSERLTEAASEQANQAKQHAAAAVRQAMLFEEQTRQLTRPSISIRFNAHSLFEATGSEPKILSPYDLMAIRDLARSVFVNNSGPGVAWGIEVEVLALGPTKSANGKDLPKAQRCRGMLGPDESTQIQFPADLLTLLWKGVAPTYDMAIIFSVYAYASGSTYDEDLDPVDELVDQAMRSHSAHAGVILEQVMTPGSGPLMDAVRVLTDDELYPLLNRQIDPNSMQKLPVRTIVST